MHKIQLRKEFLAKRNLLTETEASKLCEQIASQFFKTFDLSSFAAIHIFLPIKEKKEIDTYLIIERLWKDWPNITVVISKSDMITCTIQNFIYSPQTKVVANKWGIPEPEGAQSFPDEKIDMVLLPLLAFDLYGNRVGYGKGFYDRFILNLRKNVVKCGLSFFEPVPQIVDTNDYDQKLNICITSEKVYNFN
jgi:5-formyltetrahydrofolate cyclo-ligase